MKLSAQHSSGGLSGSVRNIQTGELIHFQFLRGVKQLPLEVVLGDKRLEVMLRIAPVETDAGDDLDMELTFCAPEVNTTAALDYVPKIAPPVAGGKIDQDGAAMAPLTAKEEIQIGEEAPAELRDAVLSELERASAQYQLTPSDLALEQAEGIEESLFEGGDQVNTGEQEPREDAHPATKVPSLPGVGGRGGKRRNR